MGDGYVSSNGKNPYFKLSMTSKKYLTYLSSEVFPFLSTDVKIECTAEKSAKHARETGLNSDADVSNYSDVYRLFTRCHPELHQYREWYSSGSKAFPKEIKLTPTTLKHWYCGDGSFDEERSSARIYCSNERGEKDKVMDMFEWAGLEDFTWYRREEHRGWDDRVSVRFGKEGTKWFFRHIGDPLPGFEYKWPDDYTHQNNAEAVN